jgi:hypothetical protein
LIATDPLSLVFIFCFLVGFGFFIASALLGGHGQSHAHGVGHAHSIGHAHVTAHGHGHTAGHAPAHGSQSAPRSGAQHVRFSPFAHLNPLSIALFLLAFGFFGYFFLHFANLAVSLTLILAVGSGLAIATFLILLLNRLFANSEGSTEQDVADRTGMIGKVSITIPEKGLGEIIYTSPGGLRKSIAARGLNNQRVERDQEVVVVNYQNGVADVDTWEHFMHETRHFADPSPLDDLNQFRSRRNGSRLSEAEMVIRQEME